MLYTFLEAAFALAEADGMEASAQYEPQKENTLPLQVDAIGRYFIEAYISILEVTTLHSLAAFSSH